MTAKMTANFAHAGAQLRMAMESSLLVRIVNGLLRTLVDAGPAVFKTVCGALLRRPGWVRFPSIPASLGG